MSIATGHQHGVPGREGTRFTVSYTGLCHMGALAGAMAVTSHCHIEGWKETRKQAVKTAGWGYPSAQWDTSALVPNPLFLESYSRCKWQPGMAASRQWPSVTARTSRQRSRTHGAMGI